MSLNDYQKCPGLDRSLSAVPREFDCPDCRHTVEIWTDEKRGRCPNCGILIDNPNPIKAGPFAPQFDPLESNSVGHLNELKRLAIQLGASNAEIISSKEIVVEQSLANLCKGDPPCQNYGLAPSCPPHISGPAGFRRWQKTSTHSIVVRIDLPTSVLFSDERRGIMTLLHGVVAGVEQEAVELGYRESIALAGGSCKQLFCYDHATCRVLSNQGECRNPLSARPSMSGFGVNVARLMQITGWDGEQANCQHATKEDSMTWVAGLIVIAGSEIDLAADH